MIGLFLVAVIGAAIGAAFYFGRLSSEIERLSKRLGDVERKVAALSQAPREARPPAPFAIEQPAPVATADVPEPSKPEPVTAPPSLAPAAAPPGTYGGVEQAIGTKWAVWIGGVALALGGLFLVRYSIEAGLLGPRVRVMLGGLLAIVLALAGEWTRRREPSLGAALPSAYVPGMLTAAAIVVAFGTIYAAHGLYGFIGPTAAFVLLGATGLASMLGALRHGPALAGLGLAASYVTPLLITSPSPNSWPLVLFLAVVAASAYVLARARRWLWLATVVVAGAIAWGFVLMLAGGVEAQSPAVIHTLAQLGFAVLFMAVEPHLGVRDPSARFDPTASITLGALSLLVIVGLASLPFAHAGWLPLGAIAVALLAAGGYLSAPAAAALPLAGAVVFGVSMLWPGLDAAPEATRLLPGVRESFRLPQTISTYLIMMILLALGLAAAATLRLWRGQMLRPEIAAAYTAAATVVPLVIFAVAYLRITQFAISVPFTAAGLGLAAAFAYAADRFQRHEQEGISGTELVTGAFAAAAIAALALGLTTMLERGYLTVALALAAWGAAWVASVRDIALLRYAVTALGAAVLARMLYDPRIMGESAGTWPIVNWLLAGYGVPAVALWHAARMLRSHGEDAAVRMADSLAVLFTALLVFFQVRHLMNGGDPFAARIDHVELGLHVVSAFALMLIMARQDFLRSNPVYRIASRILGGLGMAGAVLGLGVLANPLFSGDPVTGRLIMSSLLLGYLLPGFMALYTVRQITVASPAAFTMALAVTGLLLIVAYVTLSVRHAFQGSGIAIWTPTSQAEHWAHSAAWLALGVAVLLYGLRRKTIEARIASGLLVGLAATKIAIFDLADVEGLWRALSFLCLGAVLIGIGILYQRLIFGRPNMPPPVATPSG